VTTTPAVWALAAAAGTSSRSSIICPTSSSTAKARRRPPAQTTTPRAERPVGGEPEPGGDPDHLERVAAEHDHLLAGDGVHVATAERERLLDAAHRQRPLEACGADDQDVDRLAHLPAAGVIDHTR
jgi:hypothetical protein